ncbi:PTS-dependent dihydroxyacetone kinase, ADP-binding subunit DhaL [Caloramator mitchellensis]|uniref:phosphoenolpyruvate--glycerone phosphotransferase n=1 Tax=Caloramator mitchellensis TaxID=908809 RepID=A0A0R3JVT8_CALMK|nr:dihydroxyacetone kinase subunit DhaL [Caloramator mitchellensis]KRQ87696.1 PTS-dependent dihydroxyacetone kinase, ADP-binding subunit DhaL [Caloramator mitchellensis]
MSLNVEQTLRIIYKIGDKIEENKQYLTELDAAIGDGDHGINLSKGFRAAVEKLRNTQVKDIGETMKIVGMALVSNVGGASGPLYGTAFMKSGQAMIGKTEIDINDFYKMLYEALSGIKLRGKATVGEKTMVDAIEPALNELKNAIDEGFGAISALERAKNAALSGMHFTKEIAATKGRASYLGERSIGHQDAGATSSYIILDCIYEEVKNILEGK